MLLDKSGSSDGALDVASVLKCSAGFGKTRYHETCKKVQEKLLPRWTTKTLVQHYYQWLLSMKPMTRFRAAFLFKSVPNLPFHEANILSSRWGRGLWSRAFCMVDKADTKTSRKTSSDSPNLAAVSSSLPRTIRTFWPFSSSWGSLQVANKIK